MTEGQMALTAKSAEAADGFLVQQDPAYGVRCPKCGAEPGRRCYRKSNWTSEPDRDLKNPHRERKAAARPEKPPKPRSQKPAHIALCAVRWIGDGVAKVRHECAGVGAKPRLFSERERELVAEIDAALKAIEEGPLKQYTQLVKSGGGKRG